MWFALLASGVLGPPIQTAPAFDAPARLDAEIAIARRESYRQTEVERPQPTAKVHIAGIDAGDMAAGLPDGRRLAESRTCYTLNMTRDGEMRPVGVAWQTVKHSDRDGRPVLEVVVHQSVNAGAFDMRDYFVLDAATLRPLSLVNRRHGKTHVTLAYGEDRITGERVESDGSVRQIDVPLDGPVWDGNLFGLTFAALPLAEGATFSLPYWHYDKGFGRFSVRVTGSTVVATDSGPTEAWEVEGGVEGGQTASYLITRDEPHELSYSAPQGSQTPGGDCSALEAAE